MKIELKEITVKELVEGYEDNKAGGVTGYSGKLDIRPPYQREFVYKDKQRDAVIATINKGFPLNVMYWAVRDDGTYEVIDGQQRTISIAQYRHGGFSFKDKYFHNLLDSQRRVILDYKLMVYLCSGTDEERLDWFRTINIAGEKLTSQELRNAVYAGSWLSDAKRYFSRTGCPAYQIGKDYITGAPIRQDYLETAIKWTSEGQIEAYMAKRQHEPTAVALWNYFQSVMSWIEATFTVKRKREMTKVDWGSLYNTYKDDSLNPTEIEDEVSVLMQDDEVTKKAGIYPYVLTRDQKHLNIRTFTDTQKREAYERQNRICPACSGEFEISEMEGDHITPWSQGGKTNDENCQMLCKECNRRKSAR